jgi:hypothetical protein
MPRPLYCPSCHTEIKRDMINARRPFPCPSCQKLLSIPSYYYPIPGIAATVLCAAVGYLLDLRDIRLAVFVIVFWFPMLAFFFAVLKLTFNPEITEYHSSLTK